jgi:hypothetical protein
VCRPPAHLVSFMCAHFAPRSGGHDTGGSSVAPFDVATSANSSRIVWCGSATSCAAEAGKLFDVVSSLRCRDYGNKARKSWLPRPSCDQWLPTNAKWTLLNDLMWSTDRLK